MFRSFSETVDWRGFLAGGGLLAALGALAFSYLPGIFAGAGLALFGVGEWFNMRGKSVETLRYGDRRARHPATLQRLGKTVAIIGGILLAEGLVKLFALAA